jgi:ABC-2 type transport system ATP-binding protein
VRAGQDRVPHHPLHGRGAAGTPDDLGGRSELPARIRFRPPAHRLDFPVVADAQVVSVNGHVEITTPDAAAGAHAVTAWALAHGVQLEDFSVTRPSLEDVYLELTR